MELPLKEEAEGEKEDPGGPEERGQGGLAGGHNLGIERGKTLTEMMMTLGQRGQMQALERMRGRQPHPPQERGTAMLGPPLGSIGQMPLGHQPPLPLPSSH